MYKRCDTVSVCLGLLLEERVGVLIVEVEIDEDIRLTDSSSDMVANWLKVVCHRVLCIHGECSGFLGSDLCLELELVLTAI